MFATTRTPLPASHRYGLALALLSWTGLACAGESIATRYTGHVGKRAATLYLVDQESGCGGGQRLLTGMYRYDGVSQWLSVQATRDEAGHLALVENGRVTGVTGAMMLNGRGGALKGRWISPDGERLLPVELHEAALSKAEREKLDDQLERLAHENDDC
ncbi:hypothetical protein [Lysobacter antibioticus]|uniref:hypothetical protein n=1 Tax=Lysobacter antibioticus TaxID=84531 RepID=UPI0007171F59|nr:hypothetical protein [Lysobacter antibioticus]